MPGTNLDMDVLRTFVVATDLGGFVRAAAQLGRSQSAISLQMKKLEEQVGQQLFRKQGRGLALTQAGDLVLNYARRILDLNDEAISAAKGSATEGSVRLGLPHDFAERWLAPVLKQFNLEHPNVHVQLQVERSRDLLNEIAQGTLDLALAHGNAEYVSFRADLPIAWIARMGTVPDPRTLLSLALLDPPCMFRQTAVESLEGSKRQWRLALTSPSLAGLWAAVQAGIGVTVRTSLCLPEGLGILDTPDLPRLPSISLVIASRSRRLSPPGERLRGILTEHLLAALPEGVSRTRAAFDAADIAAHELNDEFVQPMA